MIAVTSPNIWTPDSRIPWWQVLFAGAQRNPATGGVKRKTSRGAGIRNAGCKGRCCKPPPPLYIQAKKCVDNTDVDLWFPLADHTDDGTDTGTIVPYYFTLSGVVYYLNASCNVDLTAGTLATGYADAAACPVYWQAKLCSTGADVDLWLPASAITDPFFFSIGTTRYYIYSVTCNYSTTPGTIATGYTVRTDCFGAGCCPGTPDRYTPRTFLVTVSGVTACPPRDGYTFNDINGTYEVVYTGGLNCSWVLNMGVIAAYDGSRGGAARSYTGIISYLCGGISGVDASGIFYSHGSGVTVFSDDGSGGNGPSTGFIGPAAANCCTPPSMTANPNTCADGVPWAGGTATAVAGSV